MPDRTCTVEDCDTPFFARGFCHKHYDADRYQRLRDKIRAQAQAAYDPAKASEQHRAHYARNAEARREYSRRYRREHPEKARAHVERWTELNRERKNAADREAWARDPEASAARHRAWYEANKGKAYAANARRRARKRGATVEPVDFEAILLQHGMVCHLCGGDIASRSDLHFDHVIPLARHGAHSAENIRPAHAFCNLSKGARLTS